MTVFISVVSHGHSGLINDLKCLQYLVDDFVVVIKSNKPNDDFSSLKLSNNCYWIDDNYGLGFGCNNNIVFEYCCSELGMNDNDLFLVLNPDVLISPIAIHELRHAMLRDQIDIATINLFKNQDLTIYDNSIRKFPSFLNFITSFIGLGNGSIIDKSKIYGRKEVDWAAGSFLAFSCYLYRKVGGFDKRYFMYCEDIDICYRSSLLGHFVMYYADIKAIHLAKHANRKILSKHFYWHVSGAFRFLITKTRAKYK